MEPLQAVSRGVGPQAQSVQLRDSEIRAQTDDAGRALPAHRAFDRVGRKDVVADLAVRAEAAGVPGAIVLERSVASFVAARAAAPA